MVDQIATISLLIKKDNNNELRVRVYNFIFLEDCFGSYAPELFEEHLNKAKKNYFKNIELMWPEFEKEKRDIEYLKNGKDLQNIYQRYHILIYRKV